MYLSCILHIISLVFSSLGKQCFLTFSFHYFQSDRLQKVLEYVNEVHSLCGVLGLDFRKTVDEVHPSLHETGSGQSTNISNNTLEGLAQAVQKLKAERKLRIEKVIIILGSFRLGLFCKRNLHSFFILQLRFTFFAFAILARDNFLWTEPPPSENHLFCTFITQRARDIFVQKEYISVQKLSKQKRGG